MEHIDVTTEDGFSPRAPESREYESYDDPSSSPTTPGAQNNQQNNDEDEGEGYETTTLKSGLSLQWVFGMNKDLIGAVHNLSDNLRKELFYVSGHIGVIYNYERHQQTLLQGHTNAISCTAVSNDKRWIVTADTGAESMIVVWDSIKGIPVKTIFNPHPNGSISVALSHDSLYIATLSQVPDKGAKETSNQELSVWDWTSEDSSPIANCIIESEDVQNYIRFHPASNKLVVTNGVKKVIFWKPDTVSFYTPPVTSKEFRIPVGEFTQSVFVPNSSLAATATKDGDIVLWKGASPSSLERNALKVVRVHNSAINFITCVGRYIVTGGDEGYVQFFDHQLRVESWFEEFDAGAITGISFEKPTFAFQDNYAENEQSENASMASGKQGGDNLGEDTSEFKAPDFIVSTVTAHIIHVHTDSFHSFSKERLKGEILIQGQEGPIQCLAAHPKRPVLGIAGLTGHLHMWDYVKKKLLSVTIFKNLYISSISFDPKGDYLAVGGTNGVVKVLDGNRLEELISFKPCKVPILDIKFSHDSLFFATADADNCVGVYRYGHRDEDDRKPIEWVYVGRYRAHKSPITGLQFGVVPYGDAPRLMSIGEDRRLVEYDLEKSRITDGIRIKAVHKIGQSAIPTAFLWTQEENLTQIYKGEKRDFDQLLFATNQYKFMTFITPDNNKDTKCTRTMLCPAYGGPLNRLMLVPKYEEKEEEAQDGSAAYSLMKTNSKLMAYSCAEKVVGLVLLSIDGNPTKSMGLRAHSGQITGCLCSPDGKYLFTAGGIDSTVNQWLINEEVLEQQAETENEIDAFINLIEGGRNGEFFEEIQQYFYYAQIRSQGEVTTNERKITGTVPISQIPYIIRGIYFYASEYEIHNMMNEVKMILSDQQTTSHKEPHIDFETFVKVYVNHRPVFSLQKQDIRETFIKLGAEPMSGIISKDNLFKMLMEAGEKMTEKEINSCLSTLHGEDVTLEHLKEQFSANEFAEYLLGFEPEEQQTIVQEEQFIDDEEEETEDDFE